MAPALLLALACSSATPSSAPPPEPATTSTTTSTSTTTTARADETAVGETAVGETAVGETAVGENGISARLLYGASHVEGDSASTRPLVGVGLAYERNFFRNLIAVEFALEALATPEAQSYVVELVGEKPLDLSENFGVYFGGGPTVGVDVKDGHFVPGVGGLAVVGGEWFLGGGVEVFAELDTAVFRYEDVVIEADLGTGVLYRF